MANALEIKKEGMQETVVVKVNSSYVIDEEVETECAGGRLNPGV